MDFRRISLVIAESVDAWRIIPRAILILYSTLVFNLYIWYRSIPTYINEACDAGTLSVLLDKGLDVEAAKSIACSVVDIVGGPTAAQSTFVTTIIGLSTGIFGLYVATGRKWERGLPYDVVNPDNPFPYPEPPRPPNPYMPPSSNTPPNPYQPYGPQRPYGPSSPDTPYGPQNNQPYGPQKPYGPWGDGKSDDDSV